MKLTKEFLKKSSACEDGFEWYLKNGSDTVEKTIADLIATKKLDWANWLLSKKLPKCACVRYAIYAAEMGLYIFENKYPEDYRPRKAIEAARKYLKTKTDAAAEDAARAAGDAWDAVDAAEAAGDAAAGAAARVAARAAWAAGDAAWAAWAAAEAAGDAAGDATLTQIINNGLTLLE